MRVSRVVAPTLRDAPADAEAASHRLLVRAGYIRRLASGHYAFLPLGLRVLRAIETIVREEFDRAGAREIAVPALQPRQLWERSGRTESMADVLFPVAGSGGDFVLCPTAEEAVTQLVGGEIESHRDLPAVVYQITSKFRDEPRPRFGLLRTREFVMADAYSFDSSEELSAETYRRIAAAYERVFDRCRVEALPVGAHPGAIGGSVTHEYMVASSIGEDDVARCPGCGYAANTEAAIAGERRLDGDPPAEPLEEHHTAGRPGIDLVVDFFEDRRLTPGGMLKCIALKDCQGDPVVALVPGDRDVRLEAGMEPFSDADFDSFPALVKGYIGPMGLQAHGVRVVADYRVRERRAWVTGANRADHHVTGAVLDRDFTVDSWASIAKVEPNDPCAACGQPLEVVRAVEVGHTFQLGTRYSGALDATFVAEDGSERQLEMGCYGIGVTRLMAVVAEAHHDDAGLVWPRSVAPFEVHLVSLGRSPDVGDAADRAYRELVDAGVDVLYDDRDVSPGVKFADADLIGVPVQLIVGLRGLERGVVERKERATGERDELEASSVSASFR